MAPENKNIEILENDLINFSHLIAKEEKEKIKQAIFLLEELFKKQNNRKEITEATHNLEQVAENFILQKVNYIMSKNLTGKKISES